MKNLKEFRSDNDTVTVKKNQFERNLKVITFFIMSSMIFFFWVSCYNKSTPKNKIESAILDQDWQKIYDECKIDDSLFKKPETAALMGHAAIMLNKNNQSFLLLKFIDIDSTKRTNWLKWAGDFQSRFPKQAISYYLLGDAYMRNLQKDKALEQLNKALEIDPKFSLALNARGTIYSISNDKNNATNDYNNACLTNPNVAEFFSSRATMFYLGKAPEMAYQDFDKALRINPAFALASNGKACAKLFDSQSSNKNENELDSISYYLYNAYNLINLPFINENIRSLILELENRMFPEQKETPSFRVSDFLDWEALRQRTLNNKYDLLVELLNGPLPEVINSEFLFKLNSNLIKQDLFVSYLKNPSIPDSIKFKLDETLKIVSNTGKNEKQKPEFSNRSVIEIFYKGLIASYKKREPGMQISYNKGELKMVTADSYREKMSVSEIQDAQNRMDYVYKPVMRALSVIPFASAFTDNMLAHYDVATSANERRLNKENTSLTETNPGGALAEVRRLYIDNDKPYFLMCVNGLGYDSK